MSKNADFFTLKYILHFKIYHPSKSFSENTDFKGKYSPSFLKRQRRDSAAQGNCTPHRETVQGNCTPHSLQLQCHPGNGGLICTPSHCQ